MRPSPADFLVLGEGGTEGHQRAELLAAMAQALASEICHFDTASDYGDGASERLIGEFLAGRRQQLFLASKASLDVMDVDLDAGEGR